MGPFPKFNRYFVGTRYSFRSFKTILDSDPGQFSNDFYQTIELWGGVNVGKRWQFLGFIPYNINLQHSDDGTTRLGDVTVIANYNILKIGKPSGPQQRIWIGGGIKMATGKYNVDADELNPSANNQPGSGSTDWVTNAMYTLVIKRWFVNATASYKFNQAAEGFRFGNRLATSLFVYRSFPSGFATLNPTVGLMQEKLDANRINEVKVDQTGGHSLMAATGLDTSFKRFTVGFNVQLPLAQEYSGGQTNIKIRGMAHMTFTF
jgi:hypothetical protein